MKKVKLAAKKGITIIPLAASDTDKQTEYLMRTFALLTNGTYTFLTNDSGIGNNHIKPTIDSYEVEKLNDLLLRLILQRGGHFQNVMMEFPMIILIKKWKQNSIIRQTLKSLFIQTLQKD